MNQKKRIVVAMSGGVDSSVTASLLKKQGHEVTGVIMKIWDGRYPIQESGRHACYGPGEEEDIRDAKEVADYLDMPFHVFDLTDDYAHVVLEGACNKYLCGQTPNPCIVCNQKLKFGSLLQKVSESGIDFDFFATGHYARIEFNQANNRYRLMRGADRKKDQSYFLFALLQEQLKKTLFPLGDYKKDDVKAMADEMGLKVADKPESQDFIAGGDYSVLFKDEPARGPILDEGGNKIGEHKGIAFYTIGQRKGLGITSTDPMYVKKIDAKKNEIVVSPLESLYQSRLIATDINWVSIEGLKEPMRVKAKIRQKHKAAEATIEPLKEGGVLVVFKDPQKAIAPGQAVVFYDKDIVVGGGIIKEALDS